MESISMFVSYGCIGVALLISIISLWQEKHSADRLARLFLGLAAVALVVSLAVRGVNYDRIPLSSLYEFIICFVGGLLIAHLLISLKLKSPVLTLLVGLVGFAALSYVGTLSPEAMPLMPALKSKWLVAHVLTAIVSYGCFGISFCIAIMYLVKERSENPEASGIIPGCKQLDSYVHNLNVVGFAFQTLLIITGAVWAEQAWGTWWSWDPKETWSLITWLMYAAYLHGYRAWSWKGRKSAILSIIGFAVVLFTLLGVTFLLGGLHSYA